MCEAVDPVGAMASSPTLWGELAGDPRLVQAMHAAYQRVKQFVQEINHV
jgi:D-arabinitol 4-dehydrogenase